MARILVAEDDDFTLDMVRRALTGDGHDVVACADGSEALELLAGGEPFALIITDIGLPNVSGLALAEAVIEKNAAQKIIIMSAMADELTRAQNLAAANIRLLTKPLTLEEIREEAASLLV